MDPRPPEQQRNIGIFTIAFVGILLVFLFGILNYFNILRLSEIFPNYLGFLPQRDVPNGPSQQSNNVTPILRAKFSCPSVKEFCEKGQGVVKDAAYVGIGYKLSSGSAIFAAFDGDLTATSSSFPIEINGKKTYQNFKILYLDNTDLMFRAIYFFRGPKEKIKTGQVFKGQQIAVSGKPIAIYDNSSLVFSLIPGYPATNNPAILNKENFE